jgi:hypothetical protein
VQFRVYIFVQGQQSLVHQVQGSDRGDCLADGTCLEKRGSGNRYFPTSVGEPVGLLSNNLSAGYDRQAQARYLAGFHLRVDDVVDLIGPNENGSPETKQRHQNQEWESQNGFVSQCSKMTMAEASNQPLRDHGVEK